MGTDVSHYPGRFSALKSEKSNVPREADCVKSDILECVCSGKFLLVDVHVMNEFLGQVFFFLYVLSVEFHGTSL